MVALKAVYLAAEMAAKSVDKMAALKVVYLVVEMAAKMASKVCNSALRIAMFN